MSLYESNSCMPSNEWEVAQVIVLKISGALSCLGSGFIVQFVCKKWRKRRLSVDPYQRIMAGLSVYDVLFSFFTGFMGTWMTPSETGWWGAAGNVYTCSAQGFFWVFGLVGVSAYQALFSMQMVLIVVYGWTPNKFERKIERRMHVVILAAAIAIALVPLVTQTYNPWCGYCNFSPTPVKCFSWSGAKDGVECVRGSLTIARVTFSLIIGFLLLVTVYCSVAMYAVYRDVRKQEDQMNRYSFGGEEHNRESRRIRMCMLLYTGSFFLCWMVPIIIVSTPLVVHLPTSRIVFDVVSPLQGFFNMVIFFRPKCLKHQKDNPGTSLLVAYVRVVLGTPTWVKAVGGMYSSSQTTTPNTDVDEDVDDGIGFRNYNEESPDTQEASLLNEGATAESDAPPE